jgi:hypothetical protein
MDDKLFGILIVLVGYILVIALAIKFNAGKKHLPMIVIGYFLIAVFIVYHMVMI